MAEAATALTTLAAQRDAALATLARLHGAIDSFPPDVELGAPGAEATRFERRENGRLVVDGKLNADIIAWAARVRAAAIVGSGGIQPSRIKPQTL